MKNISALLLALTVLLILSGCSCEHEWLNATCIAPATCTKCGETTGLPLGHQWEDATCTTPKVCVICEIIEGKATGHSWLDATCQSPKTCMSCQLTEGTQTSHLYDDGQCATCNRRQLGVGKWRSYYVEDDQLSIVDIDFDAFTIYLTGYYRITSLDPVDLENLMQHNCSVITHEGVEYIDYLSDGVTFDYDIKDETIIMSYEEESDGSVILERIAPQQIKVIKVIGSTFFANEDWIFTYQSGPSAPESSKTEPSSAESPSAESPSAESPPTEPPSAESPSTEPPSAESPSTEPPSTEPPSTEPPSTEPPSTEPPSTESPSTEPPSTESPSTEPPSTEPPSTEPPSTEPPTTEPVYDVLIISGAQTISNQTIYTDIYITSTGIATINNVTVYGNIYCYGQLTCSGCTANNVYAYAYGSMMSCGAYDGVHGRVSGSINCNNLTIMDDALDQAFNKWGKR